MEQQPDQNQHQQAAYEEEISLYDIIQKLLVHKWFIIAFTAAALILSVAYVGFVQEPSYETSGSITLSPQPNLLQFSLQDTESVHELSIRNVYLAQSRQVAMTVDTVMQQILSEPVMREVINKLSLDMTPSRLASQIDVNTPDRSSIVTISYTSSDPHLARDIINTTLNTYQAYSLDHISRGISRQLAFIDASLTEESEKYQQIRQSYNDILDPLNQLRQQYNLSVEILNEFSIDLERAKREIHNLRNRLEYLRPRLDNIPQAVQITREVSRNAISEMLDQMSTHLLEHDQSFIIHEELPNQQYHELNSSIHQLELELNSQENNTYYLSQQKEIAQTRILAVMRKIQQLETEAELLDSSLNISLRRRTAFQNLLNEAAMEQATLEHHTPIIISYLASLPTEDTSNKKLVIAVAVLLGLFLSVLIVFVKDAYLEEKKRKSSGTGEIQI